MITIERVHLASSMMMFTEMSTVTHEEWDWND